MKTLTLAAAAILAVTLTVSQATQAGQDVESVQRALAEAGHDPGAIDGVMGPRTTAALKAYQQQNGIDATGQLDDATRAKLQPTGGDAKQSPADPAQAKKTGANVGEGAAYNRSTEKKP